MSKLEYLDALKRAMAGLPPEAVAKTLAYYEQRFIDGLAAGRSEAEIAQDLDDPKKIAVTLRASTHLSAFEQKKNPANAIRLMFSVIGLAIFNLFMVVPAIVYSALLATLYACALAFYVSGIAITASGMAGANELVLDGPLRHFVLNDDGGSDDANMQTRVAIGENGINVYQTPGPDSDADNDKDAEPAPEPASPAAAKMIRQAESVAGRGVHISTDMDSGSRTTQTFLGIGIVLTGIALFLLCVVVTKYTLIAIKRYVEMNFNVLRGH